MFQLMLLIRLIEVHALSLRQVRVVRQAKPSQISYLDSVAPPSMIFLTFCGPLIGLCEFLSSAVMLIVVFDSCSPFHI